jgi:threonine dehydratase
MLVIKAKIEAAIRLLFEEHRLVVEGSGALSVGDLLKRSVTTNQQAAFASEKRF